MNKRFSVLFKTKEDYEKHLAWIENFLDSELYEMDLPPSDQYSELLADLFKEKDFLNLLRVAYSIYIKEIDPTFSVDTLKDLFRHKAGQYGNGFLYANLETLIHVKVFRFVNLDITGASWEEKEDSVKDLILYIILYSLKRDPEINPDTPVGENIPL